MGEKMVKNGKIMVCTPAPTVNQLVKIANELEIQREDIVTILPSKNGYIMVYYYGEGKTDK